MRQNTVLALAVTALFLAPTAQAASVTDHRAAALDGADRLLDIQFESGAFPWVVGYDGEYQNVQGVTALGLLDAYRVSLDARYLDGAGETRDWLADYMEANPDGFISASNVYFLAQYALLTQETDDLDLAREALSRAVDDDRWEDTPTALAEFIITARANNYGNMGLWDVALFVRAAQDVGNTTAADAFAAVLAAQADPDNADRLVDPFDPEAETYTLGLAGLILGLTEADAVAHWSTVSAAVDALKAAQAADGSWSSGLTDGDTQATAYAVMALVAVGEVDAARSGADFLVSVQRDDGGFNADPGSALEFGETNAEAVSALVAATAPVPTAATNYGDAAVALV